MRILSRHKEPGLSRPHWLKKTSASCRFQKEVNDTNIFPAGRKEIYSMSCVIHMKQMSTGTSCALAENINL